MVATTTETITTASEDGIASFIKSIDTVVDAVRDSADRCVDLYEKNTNAALTFGQRVPSATRTDWIEQLVGTQASLVRDLSGCHRE